MNTDHGHMDSPGAVQLCSAATGVGRFLWHFLQMVLAMELGMVFYHVLLVRLLAPFGYKTLTDAYPLFGYWMMVAFMAWGMVVLMRFHKSTWRYCLAMTTAMLAPLMVLTALVLFALCPAHILYGFGDPLMFLAMAAFMLVQPAKHTHYENEPACHTA